MSDKSGNNGIGFAGLLTVLFVALKLTNVIAWRWFWVVSPIVFVVGLSIILFVLAVILANRY